MGAATKRKGEMVHVGDVGGKLKGMFPLNFCEINVIL